MIYRILLLFFHIKIVQNATDRFKDYDDITYAIPLIYNSKIYLFGYQKVRFGSSINSFSNSSTSSSDLNSTTDATTPLYNLTYIITYIKYSTGFKYKQKKITYSS